MEKKKPFYQRRLSGVRVAVWKNENEKDDVWYTTKFERSYRDGDKWKETTSYARDDLPVLRVLADLAFSAICAEQAVGSAEEE